MSLSKFFDGMHGVIFPFAGSAAPTGFLMCDGQAVSRATYAALYAGTGYSVVGSGGTNVAQASLATTSAGSGGAHRNVQPTMVLNWIIKA